MTFIVQKFLKSMKVLVTGNQGYVGSVLSQVLLEQNFEVSGCDMGFFPTNFTDKSLDLSHQLKKDVRDLTKDDLKNFDAVLHLAALSNDPLGEINSSLTNEINFLATVRLAKIAKEANVEKFVFSSSCSSYGANDDIVDENSKLSPITAYAKSKVNSEKNLLELKDDSFSPVNLRSATAYGVSPNLRLDLVVNNLTCSAITTGNVKLLSDGTAWRPLVHVEDMSNAFIHVLKNDKEKVSGQAFNVGTNNDNYKVREIAELIESIVPNSKITFQENADKDSRSYRVNFDKINDVLGFKPKWTLKDGIKQLYNAFKERNFSEKDFLDTKFYRLKSINMLLKNEIIDSSLRFHN